MVLEKHKVSIKVVLAKKSGKRKKDVENVNDRGSANY
jgi:hypothetical protein